jgi:hypothetical protein
VLRCWKVTLETLQRPNWSTVKEEAGMGEREF